MARGDQAPGLSAHATARSAEPELLDTDGEAVVKLHKPLLSQTPALDCLSGYHRHVEILIACRHKEPLRLLRLISERLDELHPLLLNNLHHLIVPAISLPDQMAELGFDPEQEADSDASASDGVITLWGKDQLSEPEYSLSPECLEHELAHLAGDETGVPEGMEQEWEQARAADANTPSTVQPYPDGIRGFPVDQGVTRMVLTEAACISNYVAGFDDPWKRRSEDWADSVSLYLSSLRHDGLHYQGKKQMFEEHFPHRAAVLKRYLGRKIPPVPARVPRSDQPAV